MKILYFTIFTALVSLDSCEEKRSQAVDTGSEEAGTTMNETLASGGVTDEAVEASNSKPGTTEWITREQRSEVKVPEFEGTDIKLYGTDNYSVYSINKGLLFTTGSAGLKAEAEQSLRKISGAITERNKEGQISIFAYIDANDNPNYNRDVAERRAQAVKEWLQQEGNIDAKRIEVKPVVEVTPEAARSLGEHRFEIVVWNKNI